MAASSSQHASHSRSKQIDYLLATDADFRDQYEDEDPYFRDLIVQHMLIDNNLIDDPAFINDMYDCEWDSACYEWNMLIERWENIIAERQRRARNRIAQRRAALAAAAARAADPRNGGRRKKRATRKRRATKSRKLRR